MAKIYSQLEKAQFENLTSDPTGAELVPGRAWYRTDLKLFRVYTGTAVQEFIDLNTAQTLVSKILTTPQINSAATFQEIATPSTPGAGFRKIYPKTDGWYEINSAGTESPIGSGGGSGKNYFPVAVNLGSAITGFAAYKNTTPGAYPEVTPGGTPSGSLTLSSSAASPLSGLANLVLAKAGTSNLQGEGYYIDFAVDVSDRGKVLALSFNYAIASGTYASDDVVVYYADKTNGALVEGAPFKLKNHSLTSDKFFSEVQVPYSCASFRLYIHVASVTTQDFSIKIDDLLFGPQAKLYGSVVTDWQNYTPTTDLTTNVINLNGRWRRVGDSLEVLASFELSGTPAAGVATISLPSGLSIDTAKLPAGTQTVNEGNSGFFGSGIWEDSGIGYKTLNVAYSTTNKIIIHDTESGSSSSLSSAKLANGDAIGISFKVPIVGWSSSQVMSSDASTRVVAMSVTTTGTFTAAQNSGTFQQITGILSPTVDTHGGFSSNSYTIKVPGTYRFGVRVSTGANAGVKSVRIYINGVSIFDVGQSAPVSWSQCTGEILYPAKAGDIVTWYYTNYTTAETWYSAYVSVELMSGPSQIMASESICAQYVTSSGQSIPNNSFTIVDFGTKIFDSGYVATGASWKFTAQVSGIYDVSGFLDLTSGGGWAVGEEVAVGIFKNGSYALRAGGHVMQVAHGTYVAIPFVSTAIRLIAGDYIDVRLYQNSGGAISLIADGTVNWVYIKRTGNY